MSPLSLPDFSGIKAEDLMKALHACEVGKGEEVLEHFQNDFSLLVGSKYAIAVSSATSGLHLALLALGITSGDEVICPTFTFAASAFPIRYQQASPIFVDSEMETWNMSPVHLQEAIKTGIARGKKPKAIVLVHSYGTGANLQAILEITAHYGIPLIEDAANALGTTSQNKQVGGFGQIGVFSFNRNKIISGGAGGCVVTDDEMLAQKIRYYAHQAKSPLPYYHHEALGYNYGISPIVAELIRLQLPSLESRVEKRRDLFNTFTELWKDTSYQTELPGTYSNRWLTVLVSEEPKRSKELLSLGARNVWKPLHTQPVFSDFSYFGNGESENLFHSAYCLPFDKDLVQNVVPDIIS